MTGRRLKVTKIVFLLIYMFILSMSCTTDASTIKDKKPKNIYKMGFYYEFRDNASKTIVVYTEYKNNPSLECPYLSQYEEKMKGPDCIRKVSKLLPDKQTRHEITELLAELFELDRYEVINTMSFFDEGVYVVDSGKRQLPKGRYKFDGKNLTIPDGSTYKLHGIFFDEICLPEVRMHFENPLDCGGYYPL